MKKNKSEFFKFVISASYICEKNNYGKMPQPIYKGYFFATIANIVIEVLILFL